MFIDHKTLQEPSPTLHHSLRRLSTQKLKTCGFDAITKQQNKRTQTQAHFREKKLIIKIDWETKARCVKRGNPCRPSLDTKIVTHIKPHVTSIFFAFPAPKLPRKRIVFCDCLFRQFDNWQSCKGKSWTCLLISMMIFWTVINDQWWVRAREIVNNSPKNTHLIGH